MTTQQKRIVLEKIVGLESDIEALKKARIEIASNGYASATLSSTGGAKSYTRLDIDKITQLIKELQSELAQYTNLLFTGEQNPVKTIVPIYSL